MFAGCIDRIDERMPNEPTHRYAHPRIACPANLSTFEHINLDARTTDAHAESADCHGDIYTNLNT